MYKVGEKVFVKDDDDSFYKGEIVSINVAELTAHVTYETDYYAKFRTVTFEQLDYWQDVMREAREFE